MEVTASVERCVNSMWHCTLVPLVVCVSPWLKFVGSYLTYWLDMGYNYTLSLVAVYSLL